MWRTSRSVSMMGFVGGQARHERCRGLPTLLERMPSGSTRWQWGAIFARPKSSTLAWPLLVTKVFSRLMSRWITGPCAYNGLLQTGGLTRKLPDNPLHVWVQVNLSTHILAGQRERFRVVRHLPAL